MKKYGDEVFIRLLQSEQEKARNKDIKKGSVIADGKELLFKEREIIKKQLWMWLPDEFHLMSIEMAKLKYPNENRPNRIYTNPETTVNISFSHKNERLKAGEEEVVRDFMEQIIHKMHPTCDILEKQSIHADGVSLAWFDFIAPALDSDIYNLMFFTSVKERLLIGSCNCLQTDQEEWKGLFVQALTTIRT